MADKESGGFWDHILNNPFGGLFDFDGDGKEDLSEQWIAYNMLKESSKNEDGYDGISYDYSWRDEVENGSDYYIDPQDYETKEDYEEALEKAKYGWRENVEEDYDAGVCPEDYETEDEYNEALEEAKYGWRDYAEDGFDECVFPEDYETEEEYEEALEEARANGIYADTFETDTADDVKEDDYPNKRRYKAAGILANQYIIFGDENQTKNRCRFILEQCDKIIAADYLTPDGDFLFSQAVKDHFELPATLPDEDEESLYPLSDIIQKIEKRNVSLALKVWNWCIEQFLPYIDYAPSQRASMTNYLIDCCLEYSDKFLKALCTFLNENPDFRTKIVREADKVPNQLPALITQMIRSGFDEAAETMFDDALFLADGRWKQINDLTDSLIYNAKDDEKEELETMEFVESHFLPKVKAYPDGMIQDEIEGWEKEIYEYKQYIEQWSDKYAYSRGNAWRNNVPDGSEYGLDPCDYDTEEEYLAAVQEEKYSWREWYLQDDTLGLDPCQFETEAEYKRAWQECFDAEQKKRRKEAQAKRISTQAEAAELLRDKTVYTYCGVKLPFSARPYSFRTDDKSLKIGDAVIVPTGDEDTETEGIIVSVGQYMRIGVPYPVEKSKFIIRKVGSKK